MKKTMRFAALMLGLILMVTCVLVGCSKKKDDPKDTTPPTGTVTGTEDDETTSSSDEEGTTAGTDSVGPVDLTAEDIAPLLKGMRNGISVGTVTTKMLEEGKATSTITLALGNDGLSYSVVSEGLNATAVVVGDMAYTAMEFGGEKDLRRVPLTADQKAELREMFRAEGMVGIPNLEDIELATRFLNANWTGVRNEDGTCVISAEMTSELIEVMLGFYAEGTKLTAEITFDAEGRATNVKHDVVLPAEMTEDGKAYAYATTTTFDYATPVINAPADTSAYVEATYEEMFGSVTDLTDEEIQALLMLDYDLTVGTVSTSISIDDEWAYTTILSMSGSNLSHATEVSEGRSVVTVVGNVAYYTFVAGEESGAYRIPMTAQQAAELTEMLKQGGLGDPLEGEALELFRNADWEGVAYPDGTKELWADVTAAMAMANGEDAETMTVEAYITFDAEGRMVNTTYYVTYEATAEMDGYTCLMEYTIDYEEPEIEAPEDLSGYVDGDYDEFFGMGSDDPEESGKPVDPEVPQEPVEMTPEEIGALMQGVQYEMTIGTVTTQMIEGDQVTQTIAIAFNELDLSYVVNSKNFASSVVVVGDVAYITMNFDSVPEAYRVPLTAEQKAEVIKLYWAEVLGTNLGVDDSEAAAGFGNTAWSGIRHADGTCVITGELTPEMIQMMVGFYLDGMTTTVEMTISADGRPISVKQDIVLPGEYMEGGEDYAYTMLTTFDYTTPVINAPADTSAYEDATYEEMFGGATEMTPEEILERLDQDFDVENVIINTTETYNGVGSSSTLIVNGANLSYEGTEDGSVVSFIIVDGQIYYSITFDGVSQNLRIASTEEQMNELFRYIVESVLGSDTDPEDPEYALLRSAEWSGIRYADGTEEIFLAVSPEILESLLGYYVEGMEFFIEVICDAEGRITRMEYTMIMPGELTGGEDMVVSEVTTIEYAVAEVTAPADQSTFVDVDYEDIFGGYEEPVEMTPEEIQGVLTQDIEMSDCEIYTVTDYGDGDFYVNMIYMKGDDFVYYVSSEELERTQIVVDGFCYFSETLYSLNANYRISLTEEQRNEMKAKYLEITLITAPIYNDAEMLEAFLASEWYGYRYSDGTEVVFTNLSPELIEVVMGYYDEDMEATMEIVRSAEGFITEINMIVTYAATEMYEESITILTTSINYYDEAIEAPEDQSTYEDKTYEEMFGGSGMNPDLLYAIYLGLDMDADSYVLGQLEDPGLNEEQYFLLALFRSYYEGKTFTMSGVLSMVEGDYFVTLDEELDLYYYIAVPEGMEMPAEGSIVTVTAVMTLMDIEEDGEVYSDYLLMAQSVEVAQ